MPAVAELEYHVADGIGRLTINRPERRNAMSQGVLEGLLEALTQARDDDRVRVVVLTGAGDAAFCAGADLGAMAADAGPIASHDGRGLLADVFHALWGLGKPTIARVRGFALAGGFGLAMSCDLVIASDDAQFGTPEINVGLWPFMITVPLLRSMPPRIALELMMTGRRVDAREAARIGFVNRVVPVVELDQAVDGFAADLAAKSPLVMRLGRDSFYRALEMRSDDALDYLQSMLTVTSLSEDTEEGVRAFVEKRAPEWRGR
jgi:enoyl-CoA hydratase/carnithine racemase